MTGFPVLRLEPFIAKKIEWPGRRRIYSLVNGAYFKLKLGLMRWSRLENVCVDDPWFRQSLKREKLRDTKRSGDGGTRTAACARWRKQNEKIGDWRKIKSFAKWPQVELVRGRVAQRCRDFYEKTICNRVDRRRGETLVCPFKRQGRIWTKCRKIVENVHS